MGSWLFRVFSALGRGLPRSDMQGRDHHRSRWGACGHPVPVRQIYARFGKRCFDLALVLALLVPACAAIILIALCLRLCQGRQVFYVSERMSSPENGFHLIKFRTMHPGEDAGCATGGDKAARVTCIGRYLRASRLDELPQIWNILRGDMSFVGPRPPLRRYVERHPEIYRKVLRSRPGLTGLATLRFARRERLILEGCSSEFETDALYSRRCVPAKARLDLLYQRSQSARFDIYLLWETARHCVGGRQKTA